MKTLLGALRALFWLTLLFALDRPYLAVLTLLSILFHELCHIVSLLCASKTMAAQTRLFGIRIAPKGLLSYRRERRVAAAGPMGGLFLSLLCFLLMPAAPEYLLDFAICNLLTSLSNLLPLEGYDGYRILACTLALHGRDTGVLHKVSFVLTALLSLVSLFLFGILGEGLFSTAFFLFSLLSALPQEKNTISENLREKRSI